MGERGQRGKKKAQKSGDVIYGWSLIIEKKLREKISDHKKHKEGGKIYTIYS